MQSTKTLILKHKGINSATFTYSRSKVLLTQHEQGGKIEPLELLAVSFKRKKKVEFSFYYK